MLDTITTFIEQSGAWMRALYTRSPAVGVAVVATIAYAALRIKLPPPLTLRPPPSRDTGANDLATDRSGFPH